MESIEAADWKPAARATIDEAVRQYPSAQELGDKMKEFLRHVPVSALPYARVGFYKNDTALLTLSSQYSMTYIEVEISLTGLPKISVGLEESEELPHFVGLYSGSSKPYMRQLMFSVLCGDEGEA